MAQTDPTSKPTSTRLWVRILLFVSLAFNLLILGAAAGIVLNARSGGKERVPPSALVRDLGLGPYMRALSREDRTELRRSAHGYQPKLHQGRSEMRAAFQETLSVLRAESLDADRLRVLIQRQAEVADRGRQLGQDLLVARISAMSLDQRHMLADRLEQAMRRGKGQKPGKR